MDAFLEAIAATTSWEDPDPDKLVHKNLEVLFTLTRNLESFILSISQRQNSFKLSRRSIHMRLKLGFSADIDQWRM